MCKVFTKRMTSIILVIVLFIIGVGNHAYATYDSESPVVDLNSIRVNMDTVTVGDEISIAMNITDNKSVVRASIQLWSPGTSKIVQSPALTYDAATETWGCTYKVTEKTPDGLIQISWIHAYDEEENACILSPFIDVATITHAFDFSSSTGIVLPSKLDVIDEEAFYMCNSRICIIPEGCSEIRDRAFAKSDNLLRILIPASVETIAETAFSECPNVIIYGKTDSAAEKYAKENDIVFINVD